MGSDRQSKQSSGFLSLLKRPLNPFLLLSQAVKRFTAVTRGGGHRYEAEYVAGLKDRELAKAIVGTVSVFKQHASLHVADPIPQAFHRENPTFSFNIVVPLCRH